MLKTGNNTQNDAFRSKNKELCVSLCHTCTLKCENKHQESASCHWPALELCRFLDIALDFYIWEHEMKFIRKVERLNVKQHRSR